MTNCIQLTGTWHYEAQCRLSMSVDISRVGLGRRILHYFTYPSMSWNCYTIEVRYISHFRVFTTRTDSVTGDLEYFQTKKAISSQQCTGTHCSRFKDSPILNRKMKEYFSLRASDGKYFCLWTYPLQFKRGYSRRYIGWWENVGAKYASKCRFIRILKLN